VAVVRELACATIFVLAVVSRSNAQLLELRPPPRGLAVGWSDVTGSGLAVEFVQRLPLVPASLGVAAGTGGVGAHAQVHWRGLRPPSIPGYEPSIYLSTGIARLFREGSGVARGEWDVLFGGVVWPAAKPGVFCDLGAGWFSAIGGATPARYANGFTARLLIGWAF
jgi:hypothetical protein